MKWVMVFYTFLLLNVFTVPEDDDDDASNLCLAYIYITYIEW